MRKFNPGFAALLAIMTMFVMSASAQTLHPADTVTIGWEAPTEMNDGSPIPAECTVTITAFSIPRSSADRDAEKIEHGKTTENEMVVQLLDPDVYWLGVSAACSYNGVEGNASTISWSDDSAVVLDGETFGVIYFGTLAPPSGLRKE